MNKTTEEWENTFNPLDSVEEVLTNHNWTFSRINTDELMVQVTGKSCDYRIFFIWQEEMQALQFCAQYDLIVPEKAYKDAAKALMNINENLWMGHFDLPQKSGTPNFRQTCLLRGTGHMLFDQIEDLVDISLAQCERYFHVFHMLSQSHDIAVTQDKLLELALMDTLGES